MAFDVNTFRTGLGEGGEPASSAYFNVTIMLPNGLATEDATGAVINPSGAGMSLMCLATELPHRNVETLPFRDYGPIRKIAYGSVFPDVTFEFIVTNDHYQRRLFTRWISLITQAEGLFEDAEMSNDIEYYDEYHSPDISITCYDKLGSPNLIMKLVEAYPIAMSSTPLNWGAKDQYQKLIVTFAYRTTVTLRGEPTIVDGRSTPSNPTGLPAVDALLNPLEDLISRAGRAQEQGTQIVNKYENIVFTAVNSVETGLDRLSGFKKRAENTIKSTRQSLNNVRSLGKKIRGFKIP